MSEPTLRIQSTAKPSHGRTLIRGRKFPRFTIPAKYCTREAKAMAITEGRIVLGAGRRFTEVTA
jgi:hypothetical protein